MPETMQDVFWDGFADEVEKISNAKTKLAVGAGVGAGLAAGAAALAGKGRKYPDMQAKGFTGASNSHSSRVKAQMDAAE